MSFFFFCIIHHDNLLLFCNPKSLTYRLVIKLLFCDLLSSSSLFFILPYYLYRKYIYTPLFNSSGSHIYCFPFPLFRFLRPYSWLENQGVIVTVVIILFTISTYIIYIYIFDLEILKKNDSNRI